MNTRSKKGARRSKEAERSNEAENNNSNGVSCCGATSADT